MRTSYTLCGAVLICVLALFLGHRLTLSDVCDDLVVNECDTGITDVVPRTTALKNLLSVAQVLELRSNGFELIGLLANSNGLVDAHFGGKVISKGLHRVRNGSLKLGAGTQGDDLVIGLDREVKVAMRSFGVFRFDSHSTRVLKYLHQALNIS